MASPDYSFSTNWSIDAPVDRVVEVILRSEEWQSWWTGLDKVTILNHVHGVGARYICLWRSNTGYKLATEIEVTEFNGGTDIVFVSSGDLEGKGRFMARPSWDGTIITIEWNVSPTKAWMRTLSFVLRPVFIANHQALMRQGEIGLRTYVQGNNS